MAAASKEVTKEVIQYLQSAFVSDEKSELAQNVATRQGIEQLLISRNRTVGRIHSYNCLVTKESKPITHQKGSGRCWIFALLNTIRIPFAQKFELSDWEFSQTFLFFWDKIERANYFLESFIKTRDQPVDGRLIQWLLDDPFSDGGQWDMLVNLVTKYGLVPKAYYPESHGSLASKGFNRIITRKLREYCSILRGMEGKTEADLREEKKWMLSEIYRICCISLGTPPSCFDWEYQDKNGGYHCVPNLTPTSFYETQVKPLFDIESKICLINDPRPEHPYNRLYTVQFLGNVLEGYPVRYVNLPVQSLRECAVRSLKEGEAVWFGCDVDQHFDGKEGLSDLELHNTKLALGISFRDLGKAEKLQYKESLMTHAMVFVGVHLEGEADQPRRWKVENSWGAEHGKGGYLMMTDDWFTEYVYEVVVDKKHVPPEVVAVLEQKAVELPPWDPMGSLA